jgi:hypothetical protein
MVTGAESDVVHVSEEFGCPELLHKDGARGQGLKEHVAGEAGHTSRIYNHGRKLYTVW